MTQFVNTYRNTIYGLLMVALWFAALLSYVILNDIELTLLAFGAMLVAAWKELTSRPLNYEGANF